MTYTPDERALIWLHACAKLDLKVCDALLEKADSPEILFRDFEKISADVILKGQKGVYKEGSLSNRTAQLENFLAILDKKGCFAVTRCSEDYPAQLATIDAAPIVLFGRGNRELLKEKMFCIVGSRKTPLWAAKMGSRISGVLSERFAIVTGLAEGGDLAAIEGALPGGKLVCVLPCGLDMCYPPAHASLKEEIARKGLLLSERLFGEKVKPGAFHLRNRILAGLVKGVLVLSAGARSGALITANYAVDYSRDVYAFPYNPGVTQGVGCNELIKKGAFLCTDERDIFDIYGMTVRGKPVIELSEEELRVMQVLLEGEEMHSAAIGEKAGMEIFEIVAVLTELELKGLVVKTGGNRYRTIR